MPLKVTHITYQINSQNVEDAILMHCDNRLTESKKFGPKKFLLGFLLNKTIPRRNWQTLKQQAAGQIIPFIPSLLPSSLPPASNFSTATFCGEKAVKRGNPPLISLAAAEKAEVSHQSTQHGARNWDVVCGPKGKISFAWFFWKAAKTGISSCWAVCCEGRCVSSLNSTQLWRWACWQKPYFSIVKRWDSKKWSPLSKLCNVPSLYCWKLSHTFQNTLVCAKTISFVFGDIFDKRTKSKEHCLQKGQMNYVAVKL